MFVPFLYELRDRGVKVGAQEALSLAEALGLGLHKGTLDGFYEVARALCVHREQDLDAFDRAFAHHFRGVPDDALALTEELLQWLEQPAAKRQLTELEKQILERLDLAQARERLRQRLLEQRERHDGGNRGGGAGGAPPPGGGAAPGGARESGPPAPGAPPCRWTPATSRSRCGACGPSCARARWTSWTSRPPSTRRRATPVSWRSRCGRSAGRICASSCSSTWAGPWTRMPTSPSGSSRPRNALPTSRSCARTTSTIASTATSTRPPP